MKSNPSKLPIDLRAVVLQQLLALSAIQLIGLPLNYLLLPRPSIAASQKISQPQKIVESSAAVIPTTEQQQAISRRLTGTWKLTAPKGATVQEAEAVWMVLRPTGQDSTMVVYTAGKLKLQPKFKYRVAALRTVDSAQLIELKINVGKHESTMLLEFRSDRQFRFEFPESADSLKFTDDAIIGTKTSSSTNMPLPNSGKKVARQADEKKTLQKLDSILRHQLFYRFNNPNYADSLQQLGIEDISDSSYQYKMDNVIEKQAIVTATPMVKGLRQYVGTIYTNPNSKAYESIICESDRSRNAALDNQAINFPNNRATGRLQCPRNYHLAQW